MGREFILGGKTAVDVDILLESRLLVQANSGAGKSWALRRILEQSHGLTQHIVLDVEDEFGTLREKFDYVLAAPHGDCAVTVQSSALLARRLLEHRVSAIVSLYELKAHERVAFVRRFLDSMISAPKELWHPCMIVIDEAHLFCPQTGAAESSSAVIDLMTRGRKRGFCGVLATQRLSKLHKDAAAEANNKCIGRSALDVDMKRAADELGFGKERQRELRSLGAGEFFVFGPAVTGEGVCQVTVGPVQTSHPKIGALRAEPRPPSAKVKAILAKLGDLPAAAVEEAQGMEAAQARIRALERQLRERPAPSPASDVTALRQRVTETERKLKEQSRNLTVLRRLVTDKANELAHAVSRSHTESEQVETIIRPPTPIRAPDPLGEILSVAKESLGGAPRISQPRVRAVTEMLDSSGLRGGGLRMLQALAQHYPAKLTKAQWGTASKMTHTGGSFHTHQTTLATACFVEKHGDMFTITDEGLQAVGQERRAAPAPGPDRVEFWAQAVGGKSGDMLRLLLNEPTHALLKRDLASEIGMVATGGGFHTQLSKLRSNELVYVSKDAGGEPGEVVVHLSKWLVEN